MDAFLGPNFEDQEVRSKKKEDIKNLHMEDRRITMELPHDYWEKVNTRGAFDSVEKFLEYISSFK